MVGKTICRYRIPEKPGSRGMDVAYKAEDTRLHVLVALKTLAVALLLSSACLLPLAPARTSGAVGLRLYVEKYNAAAQATYASLGMSMSEYLVMEDLTLRNDAGSNTTRD